MAGFFNEMERVIKNNSDNALEIALHYYGQIFCLLRPQKTDVFSHVHGKDAGTDLQVVSKFEGIIQSDDFSSTDGKFSANFEEGFLYTKHKDIKVGDVLRVDGGGGLRMLKVEAKEDIGYSTDMFIKYRLSNRN